MRIENRVFLVTGGSSGLGAATAKMLVEQGGKVVLADINAEAGAAKAAELGAQARFVRADIASEADGRQAVATALEAFGGLHGLANCAGVAPAEKVLGRNGIHALESFRRVIDINLVGSFNMLRLAAEAMSQGQPDEGGERGVIVNTASVAAFDGQIGQAAYSASKSGVVGMTLPIARELARFGIRVMTIAPGIFETPMMAGMPQEVRDSLGASVPFPPRLGRPDEYAALVRQIIENSRAGAPASRRSGRGRARLRARRRPGPGAGAPGGAWRRVGARHAVLDAEQDVWLGHEGADARPRHVARRQRRGRAGRGHGKHVQRALLAGARP